MTSEEKLLKFSGLTEEDLKPTKKMDILMDLISIEKTNSDKLGYDWEIIKVGDVEVQKKYVAQLNPKGTQENPFTDKSVLINNAWYLLDGKLYVYMNGEFVEW